MRRMAVFLLLCLLAVQVISAMLVKSPGSDEMTYIEAGYKYWTTGDLRYNQEHPPLPKLLAALPVLSTGVPSPDPMGVFLPRLMILVLSMLLGIYVFRWADELYGFRAGLSALAFYIFMPNILAWSGMVIPSLPVACFSFIALYYFWKYMKSGELKALFLLSAATGLALLSDFSALLLFPAFLIIIFVYLIDGWMPMFLHSTALFLFIIAIVIFAGYGFQISTLEAQAFDKSRIEQIPEILTQVPLPATPYIAGLYYQFVHASTGHDAFLMGMYSETGWWYYYFAVFLLKTPLPLFILLAAALYAFRREIKRNEMHLLLPVIFIFLFFSFSKFDTGIRHMLLVYPLISVFVSRLYSRHRMLAVMLLAWLVTSSILIYPHYIAYFNEFAI